MSGATRPLLMRSEGAYAGYALALDFKNGIYRVGDTVAADPKLLPGFNAYVRSGTAYEQSADLATVISFAANVLPIVPGSGYWSRTGTTNVFLNSAAPVTQTITTAVLTYTLAFIGSGTIILSGAAAAGPLVGIGPNNRASLTFASSGGALTLTLSGDVRYVTLVAGSLPGPIIITAGVPAAAGTGNLLLDYGVADEDFLVWAVGTLPNVAGTFDTLVSFNDGTATNELGLYRPSTLLAKGYAVGAGGNYVPPGAGASGAQRLAILLRRRAGKWTSAVKLGNGSIVIDAESATLAMVPMTKLNIGRSVATTALLQGPVEGVFHKRGTFSDADMTGILKQVFEPETVALLARFTTEPTLERKYLIDDLIRALKTAGVWTKLDVFYMLAAADAQAASLDWKGNAGKDLTIFGTPTFLANRGYTGDGVSAYLDTNYNPTAASLGGTLNDMHGGVFTLTNSTNTSDDMAGGSRFRICGRNSSGAAVFINTTAGKAGAAGFSSVPHHVLGIRRDNTAQLIFDNGMQNSTASNASVSLATQIFLLRGASAFSDRQLAAAHVGKALSDVEALAIYNAQYTYLQAVGAAP